MSKPQRASSTGIAKSAARKKSKKLLPPEPPTSISDSLDPAFFNFPQSPYPIDVQYDESYYRSELPLPPLPPGASLTPAGYSIDYNLSLQNGSPLAGLSAPFNITHDDLISAANELYKRMADPEFGSDDLYWQSLPPHIRQFIRDAVPFTGSINSGTPGNNNSQRTMYQMAQQIVQAASQGMGLGQGMGVNMTNGGKFPMPTPNQAQNQHNQSLGEELGFHRHPDFGQKNQEEDIDEEDEIEDEHDNEHGHVDVTPNGEAPNKKNKKKKKKKSSSGAAAQLESSAQLPPLPPPSSLPKVSPRAPVSAPVSSPAFATNPAPAPAPLPPALNPPSSRAAGKQPMGHGPPANPPARSARAAGKAPASSAPSPHGHPHPHPHHAHNHPTSKSSTASAKGKAPAPAPPAKIWTQSSAEDRENIRQFWLGLSEAERRDLLRIEKDAVLKKMKEQHRHSCGCAVCGRKKVNIEMELDQLYEQYYDELRSYAAEQRTAANGLRPPPLGAGPFPGSVEVDAAGTVTRYDHRAPLPEDDHDEEGEESEEYDEEYEEDEDDLDEEDIGTDEADVGDDEEPPVVAPPISHRQPRQPSRKPPTRGDGEEDFLSFGSSLATIKGILTIADDMLKNDGSKFLEMMEQLAIRRSAREEQNLREMQEETDEEEDDDDMQNEPLTEKERAEEGKRMFQIFAARMFEQRVLQAYRERVAKQREEQLLRELEEEEDSKRAKEEKKAKEAQKKKDKKKAQKQKAEEERLAREAALEKERRQARLRKEEEVRERVRKQEEERARREAVKRAAQEEVQRQAQERRKRQQEEKEREEEAQRKKREREEKARKEKEAREKEQKERERRERETKVAKEKAEREKKEREKAEKAERDRLVREAKNKAEKDRQAKLEVERKERTQKEEADKREREVAEQVKIIAAQQVQREKTAVENTAVERTIISARSVAVASVLAGSSVKPSTKGPAPQPTPPIPQPSPIKVASVHPSTATTSARPTHKTPTPHYAQPTPPVSVTSFQRIPIPQGFGPPGLRSAYSHQTADTFSPPRVNGTALSPNSTHRGFPANPSPPYDQTIRTAPLGIGFAPVKSASRIPSMDEAFSPTAVPIGVSTARSLSSAGEIGSFSGLDDYRPSPALPSIAPPNPGPIGRPTFSAPSPSGPSSSNSMRPSSPTPPEPVFGSAALGADDEIVQHQHRRPTVTWEMAAAPGTGRWSASPSIWGAESAWGAQGNLPAIGERPGGPPGLSLSPVSGGGVLGNQRQSSFGGIGAPFTNVGGVNSLGGGAIGSAQIGATPGAIGLGAIGMPQPPSNVVPCTSGSVGNNGYNQNSFIPQHQNQHSISHHQT
ncbi:uncharacterized protein L203_104104 [Cryptococcus depauperatus CBS 7841]|uniref:Stress response protein NST1 n=1 Tax=Cryptococcus depauperatus CBS 7841 TaxID=1295531 RepID=A0AAJ8JUV6_9TREE